MDEMITVLLRCILFVVLFVVFEVGFLIVYSTNHTDAQVGKLSIPLVVGGSLVFAAALSFGQPIQDWVRRRREAPKQVARTEAALRGFVQGLEATREFRKITLPGLNLGCDEFAIACERATLAGVRSIRSGAGVGTRVRVAGFPVYVGGWQSAPHDDLQAIGEGDLVLTNQRLLFLGPRTLTLPFAQILRVEQAAGAGIVVAETKAKTPHVFVFEMAPLWVFLVNWAMQSRFTSPRLPESVHLRVTGQPPKLEIEAAAVP